MEKKSYLKQLEMALRKKDPEPQVQDILADYEDFFATGVAEGKSEAELCSEFGSPEQAAYELRDESDAGKTPRRGKLLVLACSLLAILIFAVLLPYFGPEFNRVPYQTIPNGPVNFLFAILIPLALEAILALWSSKAVPQKKASNWIPRFNMIFGVLTVAVLTAQIYYVFAAPEQSAVFLHEGLFGRAHILMAVTYCGSAVCELLLLVSVLSLMLYSMRGHETAHWFLFLDSALLTLFLNFNAILSEINMGSYNAITGTASCFLWAVLPNLAAMGIYWVIIKIVLLRKAAGHGATLSNRG